MTRSIADPRCPACARELVAEHTSEGVVWRCPRGHGLAATLPVVRGKVEDDAVNEAWLAASGGGSGQRCPTCRTPMSPVQLAAERIDLCRRCYMVWFDEGEYERTAKAPLPSAPERPLEVRLALARLELAKLDRRRQIEAEAHVPPHEMWKAVPAAAGLPFDRGQEEGPAPATWALVVLAAPLVLWSSREQLAEREGLGVAGAALATLYLCWLFGRILEWRLGPARVLLLGAIALGVPFAVAWLVDPGLGEPPRAAESLVVALGTGALLLEPRRRFGYLGGGVRRDPSGWPYAWWNVPGWLLLTAWFLLQALFVPFEGFGMVGTATLVGVAVGLLALLLRKGRTVIPAGVSPAE